MILGMISPAWADSAEASDKGYEAASKFSSQGYAITPTKEGTGKADETVEFEVPVSRGLDYVLIVSGDRGCQAMQVWVESEDTGATLAKDTRKNRPGMAGVGWHSDYNGSVKVAVNFAKVDGSCSWCALVGRKRATGTSSEAAAAKSDAAPTKAPEPQAQK